MNPINATKYGYQQYNRYSTWSQSHWMARQINRGIGESTGFEYGNTGKSRGFMGMKGWASETRYAGRTGTKGYGKLAGKWAGRAAGGIFGAYNIISGFQEGGISGGVTAIAENAVYSRLLVPAFQIATKPGGLAVLAVAATTIGTYKFLKASQKNLKNLQRMEMVDSGLLGASRSQGAYTMRQRSLQALQNTHINGRAAMGNEGFMMHTSYR